MVIFCGFAAQEMERAEREFCDCSQRVCLARLFASEIILKITEDHFINLVEIWSKATKHGPLSLKLEKGAPALAEDALLPS